jgi:hypothetical protein
LPRNPIGKILKYELRARCRPSGADYWGTSRVVVVVVLRCSITGGDTTTGGGAYVVVVVVVLRVTSGAFEHAPSKGKDKTARIAIPLFMVSSSA